MSHLARSVLLPSGFEARITNGRIRYQDVVAKSPWARVSSRALGTVWRRLSKAKGSKTVAMPNGWEPKPEEIDMFIKLVESSEKDKAKGDKVVVDKATGGKAKGKGKKKQDDDADDDSDDDKQGKSKAAGKGKDKAAGKGKGKAPGSGKDEGKSKELTLKAHFDFTCERINAATEAVVQAEKEGEMLAFAQTSIAAAKDAVTELNCGECNFATVWSKVLTKKLNSLEQRIGICQQPPLPKAAPKAPGSFKRKLAEDDEKRARQRKEANQSVAEEELPDEGVPGSQAKGCFQGQEVDFAIDIDMNANDTLVESEMYLAVGGKGDMDHQLLTLPIDEAQNLALPAQDLAPALVAMMYEQSFEWMVEKGRMLLASCQGRDIGMLTAYIDECRAEGLPEEDLAEVVEARFCVGRCIALGLPHTDVAEAMQIQYEMEQSNIDDLIGFQMTQQMGNTITRSIAESFSLSDASGQDLSPRKLFKESV